MHCTDCTKCTFTAIQFEHLVANRIYMCICTKRNVYEIPIALIYQQNSDKTKFRKISMHTEIDIFHLNVVQKSL